MTDHARAIEAGARAAKPRPYNLNDPSEVERLLREVQGYLHTCRRDHHGTDFEGRQYAMDALKSIASGALVPASAVVEMRERCAAIADKAMVEFTLLLEYPAVSNSKSAAECATLCAKAAREIADKVRQLDTAPASGDYVVVPRSDLQVVVDIAGRNEAAPEIERVRHRLHAASRTGGEK